MAKHLDPIDPSSVTIENIDVYDKQTTDVINQIENVDIPNMEKSITDYRNHIVNLPIYKQNCLQTKHLRGTIVERDAIEDPVSWTVFFIEQS